jgi:RNA polymerase sigma factor (sigma-70 family)
MTQEEYGKAYEKGYKRTARFLVARGVPYSTAEDTAQAAWGKGWERVAQLRETTMVVTWVNSIAVNMYRSYLRHEPFLQMHDQVPEVACVPKINLAAIDVSRVLSTSNKADQLVLTRHYLEGDTMEEIATANGWTVTAVRIRMLRARRAMARKFSA